MSAAASGSASHSASGSGAATGSGGNPKKPERRVAKSLIREPTKAERDEYNKLPVLELDDLEQVQYLQTLSEGWAWPLDRFMNEQELIECMNMNTITDAHGKRHILSVPITQYLTTAQKE